MLSWRHGETKVTAVSVQPSMPFDSCNNQSVAGQLLSPLSSAAQTFVGLNSKLLQFTESSPISEEKIN